MNKGALAVIVGLVILLIILIAAAVYESGQSTPPAPSGSSQPPPATTPSSPSSSGSNSTSATDSTAQQQKCLAQIQSQIGNQNFNITDLYSCAYTCLDDACKLAQCNYNVKQIANGVPFTITDVNSCAFQYVSPPGCPPKPKALPTSGTMPGAAYSWKQSTDTNFVGNNRCGKGMNYYGTMTTPAQCQTACQTDTNCDFWTYNNNNGYMGTNTIGECWGHDATVDPTGVPNTSSWTGFTSGQRGAKI